MNKITIELTEDQARLLVNLLSDELADPHGWLTEPQLGYIHRIATKISKSLVEAKN